MISRLRLNNFRSYEAVDLELCEGINIFIGKNAQGKTNLLESIFFMSNTRSYRTKDDTDLIKNNQEYGRIIINTENDELMCTFHDKGKYFEKNRNRVPLASDFIGELKSILFYPNESELFTSSPRVRRSFIDSEISKVNKKYLKYLQMYNRLLKDRNKSLKESNVNFELLDIITGQIIDVECYIIECRIDFINHLNKYVSNIFNDISTHKSEIKIEYRSDLVNKSKEELELLYRNSIDRDIFMKSTQIGIHRDDIYFYMDDVEVFRYASQGQSRLILIAIKLSLISFIEINGDRSPILLLDDIMSELDGVHQVNLLKVIPNHIQTIITSTDQFSVFNKLENIKIFRVNKSNIESKGE